MTMYSLWGNRNSAISLHLEQLAVIFAALGITLPILCSVIWRKAKIGLECMV